MASVFEQLHIVREMDSIEARNIALGTVEIPEEFRNLDVIDLSTMPAGANFEDAGLHKRVRAGIGALVGRSMRNVEVDIWSTRTNSPKGYRDYDRTVNAHFESDGSEWGSERAAGVRVTDTYHVTGSATIEPTPRYASPDFLLGVFTDAEGIPRTLARLSLPGVVGYNSGEPPKVVHPEVLKLHRALVDRAKQVAVEGYLINQEPQLDYQD